MVSWIEFCGSGVNAVERQWSYVTGHDTCHCWKAWKERIQGFKWLAREMEKSAQPRTKKYGRWRRQYKWLYCVQLDGKSQRTHLGISGIRPSRGLPGKRCPKSPSEKKKPCRGGKKAKQRATVVFFVNAAGENKTLLVIGKSKTPRCFRKLQHQSGISPKEYSLKNRQCLDAGVIKNWKVKFRKKLLEYVCCQTGRTNAHRKASDIIKSIDLLKAIRWMEQAWQEVDPLTICEVSISLMKDAKRMMTPSQEKSCLLWTD